MKNARAKSCKLPSPPFSNCAEMIRHFHPSPWLMSAGTKVLAQKRQSRERGEELIESISHWPSVHQRHQATPLLKEREEYLAHLVQMGWSAKQVLSVSASLIQFVRTLGLTTMRMVAPAEIDLAGERWMSYRGPERLHIYHAAASPKHFVMRARRWLRFHGHLIPPADPAEGFKVQLADFEVAMESRGLTVASISTYVAQTRGFLRWISERHIKLSLVSVSDIDDFFASKREAGWRPMSLRSHSKTLRAFFTHAEKRGWCSPGIRRGIVIPRAPVNREIPKGPRWALVRRIIRSTNGTTPEELRARAVLLLLSIYGLRVSEAARLRLKDFDWRNETFFVQRAKHGGTQQFPIQHEVGDAILDYFRYARPHSPCRNIFVTLVRPYRALGPTSLGNIVRKRLENVDVPLEHRGPHALRHACATRLLSQGSSFQEIADFLGHRTTHCVAIYAHSNERLLRKVSTFSLAGIL
ncbi:MAG: tyrosine-type recombinase/integrase [Acidobacteria bacterium]|nr:tyrosine-type recombinase/integrase [Acidobacteriota bacterium]